MLSRGHRCALTIVTIAAWVVMVLAAVPHVPLTPSRELLLLAACIACVGSIVGALYGRKMPVIEVLEAGRAMGRAEVLCEQESGVRRLSERRNLRAVE